MVGTAKTRTANVKAWRGQPPRPKVEDQVGVTVPLLVPGRPPARRIGSLPGSPLPVIEPGDSRDYSRTLITTRRFSARPSRVELSAIGWDSPKLKTEMA